ncbi:uncharacterized protein LOC143711408 [Siphateles boraxobius]|uniref:uncharacterized protein LOC143711408 n=1 Tax=Siphateles boraxobius TaxID=180520 RepID=UPI004064B2D1
MDRKPKKEQKKKKKRGVFMSSSPDVVFSAAAPADHPKSSSSRKRKFPSLRRAFRRILSLILPCVSFSELDESIETHTSSIDTHTDASSSPAVSGSSDPELDLLPAIQEKEAIKTVPEDSSTSSSNSDGSSSSAESKPSDLEGCSSSSAAGNSSSVETSERIDLLAELQGTVVPEDAAGDQPVSDVELECVLDVLASVTAQSNGLSQTEILRLIQCSPQQEQIEVKQQRDTEEEDEKLADVVSTASPAKIKHLG